MAVSINNRSPPRGLKKQEVVITTNKMLLRRFTGFLALQLCNIQSRYNQQIQSSMRV